MARRCASLLALAALAAAACSDDGGAGGGPDAKSPFCAASAECGNGAWCNPLTTLCEPRGTTYTFDDDIYPTLRDTCAGCHVAGVPDSQGSGTIAVFAGGPDTAYASLIEGGTNCGTGAHRLCVDEPKASLAVGRLLTHAGATSQTLLLPSGYADPWLQKFLHWIAAGARRNNLQPDAPVAVPDAPTSLPDAQLPVPDAPLPLPDAPLPLPDAPFPPDARPPPDAPIPVPDAPMAPGQPVIVAPAANQSTGPGRIPVTFTQAAANGSAIEQYVVTAQRESDGAQTSVTCTAPFSNPPCVINANQSISVTVTGLQNCMAYDVTVTATSAGGSTTSAPVTGVTPRQAPGVPTLPAMSLAQPATVGELVFSWNAANENGCGAVSYTVELTPPPGFQCGNPASSPCLNAVGGVTSFDMVTSVPVCPYPSLNCSARRTWSFRVQASNAGGTSAFSGSVAGSPRMGYIRDSVWSIWNNAPGSCVGCHAGATVPVLNDGADTTHLTSWGSIRGTSGVVILDPQPDPLASLLHICPTFTAGCVSGNPSTHPGGMKFAVGSLEDNAIVRWITDGALF